MISIHFYGFVNTMGNLRNSQTSSIPYEISSRAECFQVSHVYLSSYIVKKLQFLKLREWSPSEKRMKHHRWLSCLSSEIVAVRDNVQKVDSLENLQQKQPVTRVKVLWRKKKKPSDDEIGTASDMNIMGRNGDGRNQCFAVSSSHLLPDVSGNVQTLVSDQWNSDFRKETSRNSGIQVRSRWESTSSSGQDRIRSESRKLELLFSASSDEQAKNWLKRVEDLSDQQLARRLFHNLAAKDFWQSASELFYRMQQQSWWSNDWPAIYIQLISCLSRARQPQAAEDVVQNIQQQGCRLSMNVLNVLLKAYVDGGWLDKARNFVETLKESEEFPPTTITYNILLKGLLDVRALEEAYQLLDEVERKGMADAVTHNLFIHLYSEQRDGCVAMEAAYERMKASNVAPEAATFNTLVQGYVKSGKLEEAIRTIDAKHKAGLDKQARPLNMIMKALVEQGKLSAAELLYDEMLRQNCETDEVTHNILMHAYGKMGDTEKMEEVFQRLLERKCSPSLVTFNVMVESYLKVKNTSKAMDLFRQMVEVGLTPNSFSYNSVFKALGKAGDMAAAEELFNHMEASGCPPNQVNFNTMLNIFAKCGAIDKMENLYKKMISAGHDADTITYTTRMNGYRLKNNWKMVEKLYLEMQEQPHPCKPSFATLATLAGAYAAGGQLEKRDAVHEQLKSLGYVKDSRNRWAANKPRSDKGQ